MKAPGEHIARADIVMRRHDEMRRGGLGRRAASQRRELVDDAVGPQSHQQVQLRCSGRRGAPIRQIDDVSLKRTIDGAVRFIDETRQVLGMPMIATGLFLVAVHALLDHRPFAPRR